jgi:hypothetical protein
MAEDIVDTLRPAANGRVFAVGVLGALFTLLYGDA